MNALTVKELYTLEETIAKDLFDKVTYPWKSFRISVHLSKNSGIR